MPAATRQYNTMSFVKCSSWKRSWTQWSKSHWNASATNHCQPLSLARTFTQIHKYSRWPIRTIPKLSVTKLLWRDNLHFLCTASFFFGGGGNLLVLNRSWRRHKIHDIIIAYTRDAHCWLLIRPQRPALLLMIMMMTLQASLTSLFFILSIFSSATSSAQRPIS